MPTRPKLTKRQVALNRFYSGLRIDGAQRREIAELFREYRNRVHDLEEEVYRLEKLIELKDLGLA